MDQHILQSMTWYFSKANRALSQISAIKPPANSDDIRFYYGVYTESICSALDLIREQQGYSHNKMKSVFTEDAYIYLRELRNSIVHRGYDLSREGTVFCDLVYVITPSDVCDKDGNHCKTPNERLLIHFLISIDEMLRGFVFDETVKLIPDDSTEEQKDINFNNLVTSILDCQNMDDVYKQVFLNNIESIKHSINSNLEPKSKRILNYEKIIKFNGFYK